MTFSAIGTIFTLTASGQSLTPHTAGDFILAEVYNFSNTTSTCTGLSSTNATWVPLTASQAGTNNAQCSRVFIGTVTAASAAAVTVSWSGTAPSFLVSGQEFSSTNGAAAVTLDKQGLLDSGAGTATWPSLTPANPSELYFGYCGAFNDTAGSTSGYVYQDDGNGNGLAYNLSCAAGTPTAPVWGTGAQLTFGIVILVTDQAAGATPPPAGTQQAYPPGWFPGSQAATAVPGGIPFCTAPVPAYAIVTPPVAPPPPPPFATPPPVAPGWFPGAPTAVPGGIPFYASPQPASTPPGGALPYITGLSASTSTQAGHFTDQYSNPRLWVASETWNLFVNAGRWSGSGGGATPHADFVAFFSQRSAQGLTVTILEPTASTNNDANAPSAVGNTWDSLTPFVGGSTDPTVGLSTGGYWTRFDDLIATAASYGVTIGFTFNAYNFSGGGVMTGWTTAQCQTYGNLIGTRYKNTPNIFYLFGNDDLPGTDDSKFDAFIAGLAAAGDTHIRIAWWSAEDTSRYTLTGTGPTVTAATWGINNSQVNFCYTYQTGYWVPEFAWGEVANQGQSVLLPVVWGDGTFYNGTSGSAYFSPDDRQLRQADWWTLTSGARGILSESGGIFTWVAASTAAISGDWFLANNQANIVTTFTSWAGWWNLRPDLSSAFVTSGRGTKSAFTTTQLGETYTNTWVSASITPDGTLACCYLPNHTTITVNTLMLAAGWTATWVDPISGATSNAGTSGTYNSTAKGNNSQGDPDWVLVFQAPASSTQPGTATLAGTGSVTTAVTQGTTGTVLGGAGSVTTAVTQGTTGTSLGAHGSLGNVAVQGSGGALGGQGTLATAAVQGAIATLSAAGSLTAAVTQGAGAILAGTGSLNASGGIAGAATLGGAGSIATSAASGSTLGGQGSIGPLATLLAPATLAGTGSLATAVTQLTSATLAGAGSITALATQLAIATLAGTGTVATAVIQGVIATLAAAGSLSNAATEGAGSTLGGAGSITGPPSIQQVPATLAGTGSLVSTGIIQGVTAALSGTGSLGTAVIQGVIATLAGTGSLTAASGQSSQLSGQGSLNATAVLGITGTTLGGTGTLGTAAAQGSGGTLGGAGSITGPAGTIAPPAVLAAAGTLTALATQGSAAALAGTGSVTTAAVQRAITTLSATGAIITSAPTQSGQLAGQGSVTGSGTVSGSAAAVLSAQGAITSLAILRVISSLAGSGSVTAGAVLQAGAVLAAAGQLTATGTQHPPQVKGFSTAYGVTRPQMSAAAVSEAAGMSASVS